MRRIAGLFAHGQDGRDVAAMSAALAYCWPDADGLLGWRSNGRTQACRDPFGINQLYAKTGASSLALWRTVNLLRWHQLALGGRAV